MSLGSFVAYPLRQRLCRFFFVLDRLFFPASFSQVHDL